MTFREALEKIKKLKCEEKRTQTEEYLEVVVPKETLPELHKVLTDYFGAPFKPEGQYASAEADRYSKPYGGIQKNQMLYFRKGDQGNELALLWPWGNGTLITVKVIQETAKLQTEISAKQSFWNIIFGPKN